MSAPDDEGKRAATLRDVADAAGVHAATASRALNPETRLLVNAETARRVLRAAEQLGYRPNPIARSLKTAKSRTIGVVIPDLTNPLFPPIVRGIEEALNAAGYSAFIVNTDADPAREQSQVESLRDRQVEGLIFATALLDHPLLRRLHTENVKMVLVNRYTDIVDVPSARPDELLGIDMAVEHLADLGHRRIIHLAGPLTTSTGVARKRAFEAAVLAHGLDDDPARIVPCSYWSEEAGAAGLRAALDADLDFTAIVAGNDLLALGCYDVFAERGIRCPEDVSVVGFNGMPFLDKLQPPLTTVAIPHHELGLQAARMLLESFSESHRPVRSVLLAPTLITRGSTAPPPHRATINVYTSATDGEPLKAAVVAVLREYGIEVVAEDPPVRGSWGQRFWVRLRDVAGSDGLRSRLRKVEHAIELQHLGKAQAEIDKSKSEAVAMLLNAMRDQDEAVVRLGSLVIVKCSGSVAVWTISESEAAQLDTNAELVEKPAQMLSYLRGLKSRPPDEPDL